MFIYISIIIIQNKAYYSIFREISPPRWVYFFLKWGGLKCEGAYFPKYKVFIYKKLEMCLIGLENTGKTTFINNINGTS